MSHYQDIVSNGLPENLHLQHIGQNLFSFPAQDQKIVFIQKSEWNKYIELKTEVVKLVCS